MTPCLMVRAQVDPAVRDRFDTWYETEHLPDAARIFGTVRAQRGWSREDASVHIALCECTDQAAIDQATQSDGLKDLIAKFDRVWGADHPHP